MRDISLIYPVFVQVAMTFVLLVWTGMKRVRAIRRREVRMSDIALGQKAWPAHVLQVGNSYQNQLELPMLFYVLVALVFITNTNDVVLTVLAWIFVGLRLVHAFIHVTGNNLTRRFYAFVLGLGVLATMWILCAWRVIAAS